MSDQQPLDERQHAIEFQKILAVWLPLRVASRTSIHTLARYEPADDQAHQARAILDALRAHGRSTARFVASQCGSSESKAVLWWVNAQLADNFALDDESAIRFDDISLIVDNALLQVEAATTSERRIMEIAIEEARKSVAEDRRHHPKVGAVVVKDGKVIASAHRGEMTLGDHAEYTVLEKKLRYESLAGATVYATLEPCTRRGPDKTPCAQRLIDRKVKRVVIGMLDPNPNICGKGQRMLQSHGIHVDHFPHELVMQLEEMNREFTKAQEAAAAMPARPPDRAAEVREQEDSKWRDERRKQAGPQLHTLLDRIKREARNFAMLRDGKPPFSEYTEVTPFELLEIDLKPVSDLQDYRGLVEELHAEITRVQSMPRGNKDVTVFLPLVERLEKLLEADVKGYPKTK